MGRGGGKIEGIQARLLCSVVGFCFISTSLYFTLLKTPMSMSKVVTNSFEVSKQLHKSEGTLKT